MTAASRRPRPGIQLAWAVVNNNCRLSLRERRLFRELISAQILSTRSGLASLTRGLDERPGDRALVSGISFKMRESVLSTAGFDSRVR